jgi:hypothetical protein
MWIRLQKGLQVSASLLGDNLEGSDVEYGILSSCGVQ